MLQKSIGTARTLSDEIILYFVRKHVKPDFSMPAFFHRFCCQEKNQQER